MNLTQNALTILKKRYLRKNEKGEIIETPEELFWRVARTVASADKLYGAKDSDVEKTAEEFYNLMTSLDFMPNSPTLMNAGTELGQLSACFVLPVEDSMEGIFEAVKNAAIIHKSGGGTGFSFSRLRPKGDVVGSTKGVSSGPVSFMTVFDTATETVKQGGRRRGANMGILRIDHPDIIDFITCKDKEGSFSNFNISVALTEEFMEKLKKDEEYELINPRTKQPAGRLKAGEVFDLIVKQAWKNGEPGVIFLDRINAANPTPEVGEIESTNPCGEQPLLPYESCNLGSINLARMVENKKVNWNKLKKVVHKAVHFLDNVIDVNKYPLPQIEEMTRANRKIGLGVMGWADMLAQMEIPYDSQEALELAEQVMSFIQKEARKASQTIAEKKGPFPNFDKSIYRSGPPMRNATVTTIAPTGTISIIAGCSSGIEPYFALYYERKAIDGKIVEMNKYLLEKLRNLGLDENDVIEHLKSHGTLQGLPVPEHLKNVFKTAGEIPVDVHIRMQAAFQKYTDNAVSKTINLPNSATVEDVKQAFLLAYELGCKGITVYRDGSRQEQVIRKGVQKVYTAPEEKFEGYPPVLDAKRVRLETSDGKIYFHFTYNSGKLAEIFINAPVKHKYQEAMELFARMASIALKLGYPEHKLIKQLKEVQEVYGSVSSLSGLLIRAISMTKTKEQTGETCPDCGGVLVLEEGCVKCYTCGFSRC